MLNKTLLLGRLSQEPETSKTKNGATRTQFYLAVERDYQSENSADYIPVICWDKLAENVAKYCYKGRMVQVEAHLQVRTYTNAEGKTQWVTNVVAEKVNFLGGKRKENTESNFDEQDVSEDYGISEEDINF